MLLFYCSCISQALELWLPIICDLSLEIIIKVIVVTCIMRLDGPSLSLWEAWQILDFIYLEIPNWFYLLTWLQCCLYMWARSKVFQVIAASGRCFLENPFFFRCARATWNNMQNNLKLLSFQLSHLSYYTRCTCCSQLIRSKCDLLLKISFTWNGFIVVFIVFPF